ncbi:MAG: DUF1877 family protein [Chitinophagaceae bacterium]
MYTFTAMSMNLTLTTVSDEDIEAVAAEPARLGILHYGELSDPDALEEDEREELLQWTPVSVKETFEVEGSFQALHYLLTGETEWNTGSFPLNFLTGQRLAIGEIGWGKVNFYTAAEVKAIAAVLDEADLHKTVARYDPVFFNEKKIYPRGYTWVEADRGSLLDKLGSLRDFIHQTAADNKGLYRTVV